MKSGDEFYLLIAQETIDYGIATPDGSKHEVLAFTRAFTSVPKAKKAAQGYYKKKRLKWYPTGFAPEIAASTDKFTYTIRKKLIE